MEDRWRADLRGCAKEVQELVKELRSQNQKPRKDGLKRLLGLMESKPYLLVFDRETMKLDPEDSVEGPTWPHLCSLFAGFALDEVRHAKSSKRKGMDAAVPTCFRKLIESAEDGKKRSGCGGMLLRCAGMLYGHILEVLRIVDSTDSSVGRDYSRVLLKHLLANPAYTTQMPSSTANGFLELHMDRGIARGIALDEDSRTATAIVAHVLQGSPSELTAEMQRRVASFLPSVCARLYAERSDPRLGNSHVTLNVLACLNAFLLRHGPDIRSQAAPMHDAAHPLVMWLLNNSREKRLRDAVVTYLRIQLQLGGLLQLDDALDDVHRFLHARIEGDGSHQWVLSSCEEGFPRVQHQQYPLLELAAAVYFHKGRAEEREADDQEGELALPVAARNVRARREATLEDIMDRAARAPLAWLPVATMLLHRFGKQSDAEALDGILSKVLAHLKENFRPADQQPSEPEESTTSWWLYLAAELAEQSAACAAQAGAESAPSSLGILRAAESSSVDVRWQALWDVALAAIQHPPSPGPVYRASLLLGEALLRWRLVRPGQRSLLLSLLSASPRDKDPQAHAVTIMGCREGLRFSSALLAAERPATDHEVQQRIEVLRSFLSHLQHCEDSEAFKHLGEACELTLTLLDLKPALSLVSQRIRDGRVVKGRDLVNLGKERSAPGFLAATAANEDFNRQLQLLQTGDQYLREEAVLPTATPQGDHAPHPTALLASLQDRAIAELAGALKAVIHVNGRKFVDSASHLQGLAVTALAALAMAAVRDARKGSGDTSAGDRDLRGSLGQCLRACASALRREAGEPTALAPEVRCCLETLVGALELLKEGCTAEDLGAALANSLLPSLEDLFVSSTWDCRPGRGAGASLDEDMFDDDFGMQSAAPTAAGGNGPAVFNESAGLMIRLKQLDIARSVGRLSPDLAAGIYERMLRWAAQIQDAPFPTGDVADAVLVGLCGAACAGSSLASRSCLSHVSTRLGGVKVSEPRFGAYMSMAESLGKHLTAKAAEDAPEETAGSRRMSLGHEAVLQTVQMLVRDMGRMLNADERRGSVTFSSWRIRLQYAQMLSVLMDDNAIVFGADENLDAMEHLLLDPCCFVRREASKVLQVFFRKFPQTQEVFKSMHGHLRLAQAANSGAELLEFEESSVVFIARTAVENPVLEGQVLYLLVVHAANRPAHRPLVAAAIEYMSRSMGYGDPTGYLGLHRLKLSWRWISERHSAELLVEVLLELVGLVEEARPRRRKNWRHPGSVLSPWAVSLLPPVMIVGDGDAQESDFRFLSESAGGATHLLEDSQFLSLLYGLSTVLSYTEAGREGQPGTLSERARAVMSAQLGVMSAVTEERLGTLSSAIAEQVIVQMLLLAEQPCGMSAPPPFFSIPQVQGAILSWANGMGNLWEWAGEASIPQLLFCMHKNLSEKRHAKHRQEAMVPLQALLGLLGDRVKLPFVVLYLCHMFSRGLHIQELQDSICQASNMMLDQVFGFGNDKLEMVVGQQSLQKLISACVESLQQRSPAFKGVESRPVLKLLFRLTLDAPECVQRALAEMAPVPDLPILSEVRELQAVQKHGMGVEQEVAIFAQAARAQSRTSRQKSVAGILSMLQDQDPDLLRAADDLQASAWELACLGAELMDRDISCLAAQLLALCGPLKPTSVAFTAPEHGSKHQLGIKYESGQPRRGDPMLPTVLAGLASNLTDDSLRVIQETHKTLWTLLCDISPQDLESIVPSSLSGTLGVFCQSSVEIFSDLPQDNPNWSLERDSLWDPCHQPYGRWVCNLAYALLMHCKHSTLRVCASVIRQQESTAELLMPFIFAELACCDCDVVGLLSRQAGRHIIQQTQQTSATRAIRLMLECLECLRCCRLDALVGHAASRVSEWCALSQYMSHNGASFKEWARVFWLDLDYLEVAAAAAACSAPFTALMYAEAACETSRGFQKLTALHDEHTGLVQTKDIMLRIYSSINEPDSISSISLLCREPLAQLQVNQHREDWASTLSVADRALQAASLQLQPTEPLQTRPEDLWDHIVRSLSGLGCMEAANAVLQQRVAQRDISARDAGRLRERWYESAWRAGQWGQVGGEKLAHDPLGSFQDESQDPGFHQSLAKAVHALREGDAGVIQSCIEEGRVREVANLAGAGIQSAAAFNESIIRLQMVDQLARAWAVQWPSMPMGRGAAADAGNQSREEMMQDLQATFLRQQQAAVSGGRFALMEPLVAFQSVLLQTLVRPIEEVMTLQLASIRAARKAGQLAWAGTSMARIRAAAGMAGPNHQLARPDAAWRLEDVKVLWAEGHRELALRLVHGLAESMDRCRDAGSSYAAQAYSLAACWLASERAGSPTDVVELMEKASQLSQREGGPEESRIACRVHFRFAEYAFNLYRGAVAQQSSRETATRHAILRAKEAQLKALKEQAEARKKQVKKVNGQYADQAVRDLLLLITRKDREVKIDKQELEGLEKGKERYLTMALSSYGRVLLLGGQYDLMAVFRLCNLWFKLGDARVNQHLYEAFQQTPSHKFLTLVYQMASRMSSSTSGPLHASGFYKVLEGIMFRLAVEHPYHTLYQIFALKNGKRPNMDGRGWEHTVDESKVAAAESLINSLRRNADVGDIVRQMETLLEMYIKLADSPVPSRGAKNMSVARELRHGFKDLYLMPVVSSVVPIRPDCRYAGSFPHIKGVGDSISFVGGINQPKLIQVFDSNGSVHKELVKSRDDLRQDAVMQQLFSLVNELLLQDETARIRQLSVATYKVVPMTPNSGLLGWVDDTMPLAEYLLGEGRNGGAHARYRGPKDIKHLDASKAMREARERGDGHRETFENICKRFSPVFRHFFLETYRRPGQWFERRLAYTRSVAVNSMVGYIIGLGDRHSSNILLKLQSAEIVHIDLGIAFEQGRLLPTPEQVPFRLTRDIVDGMGAAGCEGVMRRCSEVVLRVLRAHRDELLTIAEVLIHDPLFNWALTPKKAARQQRGGSEAAIEEAEDVELGNIDAERALTRVRQKLEGTEMGDGEPRGVEGQVQQLLHDAQDPDRLCRMYEGWAAWL